MKRRKSTMTCSPCAWGDHHHCRGIFVRLDERPWHCPCHLVDHDPARLDDATAADHARYRRPDLHRLDDTELAARWRASQPTKESA